MGWSASRLETIADSQQFYPITEKVRQVDWHGKYTAGAGSAFEAASKGTIGNHVPRPFWCPYGAPSVPCLMSLNPCK